jgi:hypothetical protein
MMRMSRLILIFTGQRVETVLGALEGETFLVPFCLPSLSVVQVVLQSVIQVEVPLYLLL